jgi:hypothetical protein
MSWQNNMQEKVTFTSRGYCFTLNKDNSSTEGEAYTHIANENISVFNELKYVLSACIFPNKRGWCFALAIMILQGYTSKTAYQLTEGAWLARTFNSYCFGWKKFVKFILDEEIQSSWDSPEIIINTHLEFIK